MPQGLGLQGGLRHLAGDGLGEGDGGGDRPMTRWGSMS
jgi:hypothetical protein